MLNAALALLSAVLLILAFPKFSLVWLAPVALAPLLVAAAREARPLRRFLWGWIAGVVYWFGVCYWIQFVLSYHGGLGDAAGWAVFLLFCFAKALHMGVFTWLAGILMRRWWAIPAVAALWVAVEVTHGPLGFAWLALGNAGIDMGYPLRLAPLTGVYGISFVFAMMSAGLALAVLRRPRLELLWLIVLPFLGFLPDLPPAARGHETALLNQPNISETEQWTANSLDDMERNQVALSLRSALLQASRPPSIIVWPEVPAPFYYYEDQHFRTYIDTLARAAHAYVLLGIVAHTAAGAPLNSAALVSPSGFAVSRYDKVNLVPFGEFVPWPFGALATKISTEVGDFAAGRRVVVSPVDGHRIGAFICYESVFPNFVRKFADGGAEVLFNISNDGWFGHSAARLQHLEIVRMRAAENRRWILRSTNDGITATIDAAGRLRGRLPLYVQATSYTGFNYESRKTVYTRFGDWFPLLCATLAIACLIAQKLL
ncbi:MAG: apolipoprotein N-acyltransferase [Candidatus Sulfopaludibacter sp.]|nr:apolipoprotein N-acyltransferase [Candidatus Sulfopaludibacter sp.]